MLARTPGVALSDVIKRGEWRSEAVFQYLRPEDACTETAVAQALDASDAEYIRAAWAGERAPAATRRLPEDV